MPIMVYLGDMSVQLSRIRNYAVVVGLCIAASFVASPSEAKEMNVQNNCVSALTAKIYDEKDFSVLVPVASLNKIPNGRRLSARGLSSGKKYKIHLSGTCSSGTKVTLSGGSTPSATCQGNGKLDAWQHDVNPDATVVCNN
jgi:hypothetical protein